MSSPLVAFDYFEVKVVNTQFKAMVRELKYDFGELAIVTYPAGDEYGKPYVLLPARSSAATSTTRSSTTRIAARWRPRDLNGKRVGVRAYTQTTGAWVRGFLAEDYGVDVDSITWVTFEEPHLAEYRDPANVERAPRARTLKQMLLDGEIDAAILGDVAERGTARAPHSGPRRGGARLGARAWRRADQPHGGHPRVDRPNRAPTWCARSIACCGRAAPPPTLPAGPGRSAALRHRRESAESLEQMVAYAFQQGLISRCPSVDELFADAGAHPGRGGGVTDDDDERASRAGLASRRRRPLYTDLSLQTLVAMLLGRARRVPVAAERRLAEAAGRSLHPARPDDRRADHLLHRRARHRERRRGQARRPRGGQGAGLLRDRHDASRWCWASCS